MHIFISIHIYYKTFHDLKFKTSILFIYPRFPSFLINWQVLRERIKIKMSENYILNIGGHL